MPKRKRKTVLENRVMALPWLRKNPVLKVMLMPPPVVNQVVQQLSLILTSSRPGVATLSLLVEVTGPLPQICIFVRKRVLVKNSHKSRKKASSPQIRRPS